MKKSKFCFVGEKRSKRAIKMGVTWKDGRLAAKSLFDALDTAGINAERCFTNASPAERGFIKSLAADGWTIIGMGSVAQTRLSLWGIKHTRIIHPAARGSIRKKERYAAHIQERLLP